MGNIATFPPLALGTSRRERFWLKTQGFFLLTIAVNRTAFSADHVLNAGFWRLQLEFFTTLEAALSAGVCTSKVTKRAEIANP